MSPRHIQLGVVCLLSWLCLLLPTEGGTVAYWEFDTYVAGLTPATVGGERMALRRAGGGGDFACVDSPALAALPNPDSAASFVGDPKTNAGCLRSPGNPVENRLLTTVSGTNVLKLHDTAWTVEGWIRCDGEDPDGFGDVILTTRDEPRWCGLTLMVVRPLRPGEGRRLSAYFAVKAQDDGEAGQAFGLRTEGVLESGRWHHIALSWDGRGDGPPAAWLLVDGVMEARSEAPADFDTVLADRYAIDCLHIGARQGSEKNSFAGDLDEFRISEGVLQPVDMLVFPERVGPLLRAHQVARKRDLLPRTPRLSDVLMRALRWRPIHAKDPHDTMQAMDAFHVTGLVWAYIHDPKVIAEVNTSGRFFQGAVTSSLSTMRNLLGLSQKADNVETQAFIQRYGCLSLDGSPNEQPWKRHWRNAFARCSGCCSNPDFEKLYVRALQTYTKAGATMIQRDEGNGNDNRPNYGGCFCDHCMDGFRTFLTERVGATELAEGGIEDIKTFDYREALRAAGAPVGDAFSRWDGGALKRHFRAYQHQVSIGFMARTRAALNESADTSVAMSCNNGVRTFDDVMQQFDWFFGELSRHHATPANLYRTAAMAGRLNRLQIVTMPKKGAHSLYGDPKGWERHTRQTIAVSYAVGAICMVPWDVYMPNTFSENRERSETARYFGKPADYADLFGFIRANDALLHGYEDAAAIGPGLFETRWGRDFPVVTEEGDDVYAFVRARPGDANAPVVVHLIDWRDTPTPFAVRLNPEAFFGDKTVGATLVAPVPYDPARHQAAEAEAQRLRKMAGSAQSFSPEQASAFKALSQARDLALVADGDDLVVRIPAIHPWALLVIEDR